MRTSQRAAILATAALAILAPAATATAAAPSPAAPNATAAISLQATIHVGPHPGAVAVNPRTDTIYTENEADNTVSVINGHANKVTATIPASSGLGIPDAIAVNPSTNSIYVANT